MKTSLKTQVHQLIDQLPDEELADICRLLVERYYDSYMLKAVQAAKRSLTPGNSLTREEALQLLPRLS
ncbi:MAG: hypothetical protein HC866_27200 [Leptolyngbyaceae cyanobacterium RU_5_1]|nr:hypothetical protein [Leptolyngbyaceae cyanobacterium RU_5_1]